MRTPLVNSSNYIFIQSTELEKDIVNNEKRIMFTNESERAYFIYANTTKEAWDQYLLLRPQITLDVKKHSAKELNVVFGTYESQTLRDIEYKLPDTSSWDSFPYVVGKDAFHQLMTIMNSLHLHETTKDTSVVYQPISVMYVESKTWKAPSSAFVYKEISWFVPLFLIAISVAPIYRVINDKVTDRVRILFLNNVTSSLYVTSLLLFYTLFFFVITCVSVF